jgi:hypothetical protein
MVRTKNEIEGDENGQATEQIEYAPDFPAEDYYKRIDDEEEYIDDEGKARVKPIVRLVIREVYATKHLTKCRIRAAKEFNVPIDHLQHAYNTLNGKKIDGFLANAMIDRYGFSDGNQYNRQIAAEKSGVTVQSFDIAFEKLKKIVKCKNVYAAYMEYVSMFEREKSVDAIIGTMGM